MIEQGPDASLPSGPCSVWTRLRASKALRASRYKALRQPIDCIALAVADHVTVDPEGYTDVAMAELISNYGDRGSAFNQFRRDRVPSTPETSRSS